jgi:maltose/moltooligosaccharide transporter
LANALPWLLGTLGVVGTLASGIPYSTYIAFIVGAVFFLTAVLWTVFSTGEYPPENMEEFRRKQQEGGIVGNIFKEIGEALREMPTTMKQLAVVQFFTWFALPFMWQFYGITVARHVFGAPDEKSPLFAQGTEWGGLCFAVYNFVCFLVAFAIPPLAKATSRKGVHIICLTLGGLGLLSTYFATSPYFLFIGMIGVGIAWASILSMPYVILAGAIPAQRIGVYMGVFNLFIVIPQIIQSFLTPQIYKSLLGDNPLNAVMLGGLSMIVAAASVLIVKDIGQEKLAGDAITVGAGH